MGRHITHGMTKTKIYHVWTQMRDRCNNPNNRAYKDYGGRGITVCDRWHKFEGFLADMGECPDGFVLDRIDNDGDYEPSNCRWTDSKTSRRNSRYIKLSVEKAKEIRKLYSKGYTQVEIAKRFGVSDMLIRYVINNKIWI